MPETKQGSLFAFAAVFTGQQSSLNTTVPDSSLHEHMSLPGNQGSELMIPYSNNSCSFPGGLEKWQFN